MLRRFNALCSLNTCSWKRVQVATAIASSGFSSLVIEDEGVTNNTANSHVLQRERELRRAGTTLFPRLDYSQNAVTCATFRTEYAHLQPDQSLDSDQVVLQGTSPNVIQI